MAALPSQMAMLSHFSLCASTLTVSSGSSRGSLASSRGSLASSRGSLSSVSFTDIYGLPQYEKPDAEGSQLLRFDLIPFDSLGRDAPFSEPPGPSGFHKQRRSLDTPQSLASLSSRSSLSSLSPPSSPLDTPFLPASRDSPLAQLADSCEGPGLGALDRLRAHASALGDEDLPGMAALQPHGVPGDGEGPHERGPPPASAPVGGSKCGCGLLRGEGYLQGRNCGVRSKDGWLSRSMVSFTFRNIDVIGKSIHLLFLICVGERSLKLTKLSFLGIWLVFKKYLIVEN